MNATMYVKFAVILVVLTCYNSVALAQTNFFEPINTSRLRAAATPKLNTVHKSLLFRIPQQPLRDYLKPAPLRNSNSASVPLLVPLPDGTSETFLIHEAPLLAPNVAAQHPDIKTYAGTG